jgi:CRISPR-associated protein Cmr2
VVVALPSVQRFIAEARTTSDVAAASAIYSALAGKIVGGFAKAPGVELVLPALGEPGPGTRPTDLGMPNRVVALFPEHAGEAAAQAAGDAVRDTWRDWVRRALGIKDGEPPETPGLPVVQWVCVPPEPGGYKAQWDKPQKLLAARRLVRDFAAVPHDGPTRG